MAALRHLMLSIAWCWVCGRATPSCEYALPAGAQQPMFKSIVSRFPQLRPTVLSTSPRIVQVAAHDCIHRTDCLSHSVSVSLTHSVSLTASVSLSGCFVPILTVNVSLALSHCFLHHSTLAVPPRKQSHLRCATSCATLLSIFLLSHTLTVYPPPLPRCPHFF
jgi:hypothetical protein